MRRIRKSRRQLEEIEWLALASLPPCHSDTPNGKSAKVDPNYHVEVDKIFCSVPRVNTAGHFGVRPA